MHIRNSAPAAEFFASDFYIYQCVYHSSKLIAFYPYYALLPELENVVAVFKIKPKNNG